MKIPRWLEHVFLVAVDRIYALIPQKKPSLGKRQQAKIIAHRGAHNTTHLENTLEAFDHALALGIWAIEFDVRWTKDLCPVVHHDENCQRVFGKNIRVADVTFDELRNVVPKIPSLQEVVERYGKKLHFMMELKEERYPDIDKQSAVLDEVLSSLSPCNDYHIIALNPDFFNYFPFLPSEACLPVASIRSKPLADLAIEKNYGGLLGHYFFVSNALIKQLKKHNKKIGLGFIASKNSLWRELNRDVFWFSTNNPDDLQRWLSE